MAAQIPANYILTRPAKLDGDAVVTYPYDTEHRRIERYYTTPRAADGSHPTTFLANDAAPYATAVLTDRSILGGDAQDVFVYEVYEDLPGPEVQTSRIDLEDGATINEIRQTVLASPSNVASTGGPTNIRYESRNGSALVAIKITTTTDLSAVVRSLPARVNLRLPRVMAGVAVSYSPQKGTGDDVSRGLWSGTGFPKHDSASASASNSLSVMAEVFVPIRDNSDAGENFPATVKQIFLGGAITEEAVLARLTAVYEVVVTGAVGAVAAYRGNAANVNGVIWFSGGSYSGRTWVSNGYEIKWAAGVWTLGTAAGILAGNFWTRTADATSWLGTNYAPHGSASGTGTVAVGRTVLPMPNWGTQEVNLVTKGASVSVKSNAAGSEELNALGGGSLSLTSGISVSVGGTQGRVRVEPTLHGAITIANPIYTDSVNATATAGLSGLISSGINSGFPTGTNPLGNTQFATAYVKFTAAPAASTPSAKVISANSAVSKTISSNTIANPTVVTTSTAHGFLDGDMVTITGSNSTPVIDGALQAITYISATTFSLAVNVTGAGTAGTVKGPTVVTTSTAHGLLSGQVVTIAGSNSTPTINGLRAVKVLTPTTFTVPVIVTSGGTAGSVQGPAIASGVIIPATDPPDVPQSGPYLILPYESSNKDPQFAQINCVVVDMSLFPFAPQLLSYSAPEATYFQWIAITQNQPWYLGGAPTSYAISPSIPAGLAFNTTTGIITGTPSAGQVATSYTVTATNGQGSTSTVITIAISI